MSDQDAQDSMASGPNCNVGGHGRVYLKPGDKSRIIKPTLYESAFYHSVRTDPSLRHIQRWTPRYFGSTPLEPSDDKKAPKEEIELENLWYGIEHVTQVDIKVGKRHWHPRADQAKRDRMDDESRATSTWELGMRLTAAEVSVETDQGHQRIEISRKLSKTLDQPGGPTWPQAMRLLFPGTDEELALTLAATGAKLSAPTPAGSALAAEHGLTSAEKSSDRSVRRQRGRVGRSLRVLDRFSSDLEGIPEEASEASEVSEAEQKGLRNGLNETLWKFPGLSLFACYGDVRPQQPFAPAPTGGTSASESELRARLSILDFDHSYKAWEGVQVDSSDEGVVEGCDSLIELIRHRKEELAGQWCSLSPNSDLEVPSSID